MIPVENNRVFGLDILRASAIVMVLTAHTWPSKSHGQWASALAVLGVELFFVLSGFLIGGILLRLDEQGRLNHWGQVFVFWRRRWFRTLPNYYLFLGLHVLWRAYVLGFPDVLQTNWRYFFFIQNVWHPPSPFFADTWSLAIEEWFYLLFPIFLWLALRCIASRRMAWALVVGCFMLVPTLLRLGEVLQPDPWRHVFAHELLRVQWQDDPRKVVAYRLDILMYGVAAAWIALHYPKVWSRLVPLVPLGVVLVGLAAASIAVGVPFDTGIPWQGFVLWPILGVGLALLLPLFATIRGGAGPLAPAVSATARLSYALYLCHGLALLALARWCGPGSSFPLPRNTVLWFVAAWIASFAVAWAVHRWFEKPLMDLRDRFERPGERAGPVIPEAAVVRER